MQKGPAQVTRKQGRRWLAFSDLSNIPSADSRWDWCRTSLDCKPTNKFAELIQLFKNVMNGDPTQALFIHL
jgi:hypothetical protein